MTAGSISTNDITTIALCTNSEQASVRYIMTIHTRFVEY